MLLHLLLSILITCIEGSELSWYPVYFPISVGSGHRHTTHIVPQPVIRTKVIVLEKQHTSNRNNLKLEKLPEHTKQNLHFHDQKLSIPHDYLSRMQPYEEDRWTASHKRFKYSLPVEESSWKPIREHIPQKYFPLKYIDEDEGRVSHIVRQALKDSDEPRTNIILPVGIKKLHNPQLRRPVAKYPSFKNGESRYVGKPKVIGYPPAWRSKSVPEDLRLYKTDIRCHCHIPHY